MTLEERVTAMGKEMTDLKRQLGGRPNNFEHTVIAIR